MSEIRYSILCDKVRGLYIPQYSKGGACWYSFEAAGGSGTLCFKTLKEAKRFIHGMKKYQHELQNEKLYGYGKALGNGEDMRVFK